jgi:hypothetical protein
MVATEAAITNQVRTRSAVGYAHLHDDRSAWFDSPLAPAPWFVNATGDGCISSTATDMTTYLRMLMNRARHSRGRLLSDETFALLTQPAAERDGRRYGYGVATWEVDGRRHLGHSGGMVGYTCDMQADVDSGVGAIVLMNSPDFDVTETICRDALDALRASVEGRPLPEVPAAIDRLAVNDSNDYAGRYAGPEDEDLLVRPDGTHLLARMNGIEVALGPIERDQFVPRGDGLDRHRLRFRREKERVVAATHGPRVWIRVPDASGGGVGEAIRTERSEGIGTRRTPPAGQAVQYTGRYRSFNPWAPAIEVFEREGGLFVVVYPFDAEEPLLPTGPKAFSVGSEPGAHRIVFDAEVDGKALRATVAGAAYYRSDR